MRRAPDSDILVPRGFRFASLAAGIKKNGQPDLALAEIPAGATAAALFTTNRVAAAPVIVGREHLRGGRVRALIVNSGNANCANGLAGMRGCREVCAALAGALRVPARQIFPSSTGVIGMAFPADRVIAALPAITAALQDSPTALAGFARAIMTTDTRAKIACARVGKENNPVTITGVAKGAGMIHPNMATMLVYLFTDAAVAAPGLRRALRAACATSLNSISVDGDTSTNDTALLLASGAAGKLSHSAKRDFQRALDDVCQSLAEQIVTDGEGVQHVVRLRVTKARSGSEARRIAQTIATSALVKTALAGADPNWGRILAAAGRSGIAFDPARVDIWFGKIPVCRKGVGLNFDEAAAHACLSQPDYEITVSLGRGRASTSLLTTDLTAEYVRINADYRS
ncbi:MAG TPA: bifunctional glutamate N-acetyltransferase/amino-acid acetyltransferase ArgJ [Terriglobales bacterium]|nr:bifunctional glutamate N-acetyltransferase/amino-acid acetyltransferase ArgJ [Terriglobales bacterium]